MKDFKIKVIPERKGGEKFTSEQKRQAFLKYIQPLKMENRYEEWVARVPNEDVELVLCAASFIDGDNKAHVIHVPRYGNFKFIHGFGYQAD